MRAGPDRTDSELGRWLTSEVHISSAPPGLVTLLEGVVPAGWRRSAVSRLPDRHKRSARAPEHGAFRAAGSGPVHGRSARREPDPIRRLGGSIQGSLELSRFVKGGISLSGTHQRLPPANSQTKCGPFHPRALPRFVGSTGLSCFHDGCLTIHALYAAGFIRAAVPSSLRLPWRSPSAPRLGSLLAPRGVLIDDAAGFT